MSHRTLAQRYRLIEPIGRGGMGTVWRADDEMLGRQVAIKEVRLPEDVSEDRRAELLARTMREGRICAGLNHPSVISVHDILQEDDQPWLVMELIDGRGLDRVVAEDGPVEPHRAARLGSQVAAALDSAHRAGVLHRDVKPANVLLTAEGRTILTDFGIAAREGDAKLTMTGKVPGAPGYVAPERMNGERMRPESDLWSLGATLYFTVEGHGPYERSTPAAQLLAPMTEDPDPMQRAGPLAPVIEGLMRRDPAQRLRGQELAAALERAAKGGGDADLTPTTLDLTKLAQEARASTQPQAPPPSRPPPSPVEAMQRAAVGDIPTEPAPAAPRTHWRRYVVAIVLGIISLILAPLFVEWLTIEFLGG